MKKLALLALVVSLGVLSSFAFARDVPGPWKVVFTQTTDIAINRSLKKGGTSYWNSKEMAKPLNELTQQGYQIVRVLQAGERVMICCEEGGDRPPRRSR